MNLFKKFATVAFGTLFSRLFGFIREVFMANAVGTGPVADAFNAAFRFPNSFRRLFAEGAFNAAFVPLFAKKIEEDGLTEARKFSEEVFGVLFSILFTMTVLMEIMMPLLVRYIIAPGFSEDPQKFSMTTHFATIMFPYLSCMSLAAMMSGMLNSLRKYFAAAIAPVFLNLILISILFYSWYHQLDSIHIGLYLSWGVMISGIIQLFIVWFAARKAGMKISLKIPRFSTNVKRLLWLALPAAITGGVTQINLLINTNIASQASGAISSLIYADRLYQLPLGVIGIAVATVLLPELTLALRGKDKTQAIAVQNRSIEFTLLLSLPASAAFLILSKPIVKLIYEHGQFTEQSTNIVSALLAIYGLGLPAFVLIKSFVPIFFAHEDTKTPMIFAIISVLLNSMLAIILFPHFSAKGIATAEISAGWLNVLLLFFTLRKRNLWKNDRLFLQRIIHIFLATFIMSIALLGFSYFFTPFFMCGVLFKQILFIILTIIGAMLVYFSTIFSLGSFPLTVILNILKNKKISPK